jgi:SAM-dependent methyltransferase
MTMQEGERQVAPTIEGIRRDHVARYEWAANQPLPGTRVIDVACGVGYGAKILAAKLLSVTALDRDHEALEYAVANYPHKRIEYVHGDVGKAPQFAQHDAAVCFETLEHLEDPRPLLRALRASVTKLFASVPNEDVFPHQGRVLFHHRHYTKGQFAALLEATGWRVREWWGQEGPESEVERDVNGRTLIAVAEHGELPAIVGPVAGQAAAVNEALGVPEHVSILGLGPSLRVYVDVVKRLGGKHAYCDEVWGVNALGGVLMCDRIFHMDDVRIQEIRAKAMPESNIARMLEWLKLHPGPVITSRAHPDYPGLVEFPLEAVLNEFQHAYFNSTPAYAVAYAAFLGVKRISLFGIDYTYPNAHDAEKGRACVEFWLGVATARGIKLTVAKTSSLLDSMHTQADRLYGYDTLDVQIRGDASGRAHVTLTERAALPSAAEIEARYDHSAPVAEQHVKGATDGQSA